MDSVLVNYQRDSLIEKELENVDIENFLEFDYSGNYTFLECEYCAGPLIGHIQSKCPKTEYDEKAVGKFQKKIKRMQIFKDKVKERGDKDRKKVAEWARPENSRTELRKQRQAPMWTGYRFEEWKIEIEKWNENLQNVSDEDKYNDLLESLKKNNQIQEFVKNTLIERVRDTRTVARILEVMSEKYGRNTGEKVLDLAKRMSGEGWKNDDSIEKMVEGFDRMIIDIEKLKMAENLRYAMGLQFLDRLEKSGKVNQMEKMKLKEIIEDEDGNPKPRQEETVERMKKELKRMRSEDFKKQPEKASSTETYYVQNDRNYRSRRENWNQSRYVRSESRPGYMRTASRGRYERDDSKFRRNFNQNQRNRSENSRRDYSKGRTQSRTPERPKSELAKTVDALAKSHEAMLKEMKDLKELVK